MHTIMVRCTHVTSRKLGYLDGAEGEAVCDDRLFLHQRDRSVLSVPNVNLEVAAALEKAAIDLILSAKRV